jgi:hypothetical protein
MSLITRKWWQILTMSVFVTFIMAGSPHLTAAKADCGIYGFFCGKPKPDPDINQEWAKHPTPEYQKLSNDEKDFWYKVCFTKSESKTTQLRDKCDKYYEGYKDSNLDSNVDQSTAQHPTAKYLKLSEKDRKWVLKQCFTKPFDWIFRKDECDKYFQGYKANGFVNTTLPTIIDPLGAVNEKIKDLKDGWLKDLLQGITDAEAAGAQWLMVEIVSAIGANEEPHINTGYVTELNNIYTLAIIIAMLAMGLGWMRATYDGDFRGAVFSVAFFVRFLFLGAFSLVITFTLLDLVDNGIVPAFMKYVEAQNAQVLENLTKVDLSKGASGAAIPIILPVLYLIPAVLGGLACAVELIIRIFAIMWRIPCIVVVLALGPSSSDWAEEKLQDLSWGLLGWILMTFFLAFTLSSGFAILSKGEQFSGKAWPIGIAAAVLLVGAPFFSWEATRALSKHSWSGGRVAQTVITKTV